MSSAMPKDLKPGATPFVLLSIQVLAFWPVWKWYTHRLHQSGEEAWGLVGVFAALCVLVRSEKSSSQAIPAASFVMTLAYGVAFPWLTPLLRAGLALSAMACLFPCFGIPIRSAFHACGFLLLSLPVIPSLQFYLGFPLRALSGELAAGLLTLSGFPVIRKGTLLTWDHLTVFIDSPCSGIKMLWSALFFTWVLSAFYKHSVVRSVVMQMVAIIAVILGNGLRTTALFFLETEIVKGPAWAHSAMGLWTFAVLIAMLAWAQHLHRYLFFPLTLGTKPCVS